MLCFSACDIFKDKVLFIILECHMFIFIFFTWWIKIERNIIDQFIYKNQLYTHISEVCFIFYNMNIFFTHYNFKSNFLCLFINTRFLNLNVYTKNIC